MKYVFYIILFFLTSVFAFSQKKLSKKQFKIDSIAIMRTKLARPQIRIDNKTLFYQGEVYNIDGVDAGVLFKEKLRVTLGYYYFNDNLNDHYKAKDYYDRRLKMHYGSLNLEVIYLNTRFFTLGLPFEFGFGSNTLKYKTLANDEFYMRSKGFVSNLDVGFSGTFKPIRWVGVRIVAGYRKTLYNSISNLNFDGPLLSFGVAVNIREISKDIRMFILKKKYKRLGNPLDTAVDLITD